MSRYGYSSLKSASTVTNNQNISLGPLDRDIAFPSDAQDTISAIRWSPTANHLAAASWDGKVYIYDASTPTNIRGVAMISTSANTPFLDCDFSKDGTQVAAGGADANLHVLDAASGATAIFSGHTKPIKAVRFVNISAASGAPIAVTGSWDNTIRYWDLRVPTAAITINCGERVYGMDTNDGGERTLVAATADKKLHVIDLRKPDSGAWDVKEARESPLNYQTKAVAVSRDGTRYAVGSIEGRASVQSVVEGDTRTRNLTWKCHRDKPEPIQGGNRTQQQTKCFAINAAAFLPTSHAILATGGSDGTFQFWNVDTHTRTKMFPNVGGSVTSIGFSYDGQYFAYAIGYDWAQGYLGNVHEHPRKLVLHAVAKAEIGGK